MLLRCLDTSCLDSALRDSSQHIGCIEVYMFGIGGTELLVILVVALLVLGPKKLPDLARTMGKALGEFRRVSTEFQRTLNTEIALDDEHKAEKDLHKGARNTHTATPYAPPDAYTGNQTGTTAATAGVAGSATGGAAGVTASAASDHSSSHEFAPACGHKSGFVPFPEYGHESGAVSSPEHGPKHGFGPSSESGSVAPLEQGPEYGHKNIVDQSYKESQHAEPRADLAPEWTAELTPEQLQANSTQDKKA